MKQSKINRVMRKTLIGALTFSLVTTMFYVPNLNKFGGSVNATVNEEVRTFLPTGTWRVGGNVNKSIGNLGGKILMEDGMYRWTVPKSGSYEFTVKGASGAMPTNFYAATSEGAIIKGSAKLRSGEVLTILVGQRGKSGTYAGGGGGGSFVVYDANNPLAVAGGGGGGSYYGDNDNISANVTTSGKSNKNASGGVSGNAGGVHPTASEQAGAGAGFKASGKTTFDGSYMYAASAPGFGGSASKSPHLEGGFGGGGSGFSFASTSGGGGGGGYSGGAGGGGYVGITSGGGGGGGSFSVLAGQDNQVGHIGDGEVTIKFLLSEGDEPLVKSFQPTGFGKKGNNIDKSVGALGGAVEMKDGMYIWTVPQDGTYQFNVKGAQGGENAEQIHNLTSTSYGGLGAIMQGNVYLEKGDKLTILVGQRGGNPKGGTNGAGGGGGGSYVFYSPSNPLVIAGGGGGAGIYDNTTKNANLASSGNQGSGQYYSNGPGGNFGHAPSSTARAGVGAGFLSTYENGLSGSHPSHATTPGYGGPGTDDYNEGGFGGGGAGRSDISSHVNANAGGGGGYSGGNNSAGGGVGGGGGSYSVLENQENQVTNTGNGEVIVELIPSLQDTKVFNPTGIGRTGNNTDKSIGGLGGTVVMENGMYKWTVPRNGLYSFEVRGAQGGHSASVSLPGGQGAILKGNKALKKGEVLTILVGQEGAATTSAASGGGGTFVAYGEENPLVVAGGGGGAGTITQNGVTETPAPHDASLTTSGKKGVGVGLGVDYGNGGILGIGGKIADGSNGGGAGFIASAFSSYGGKHMYAYSSPGTGGLASYSVYANGGFGGGGASYASYGGGGGGYSGGGAGPKGAGGGGGSYNSLDNPKAQLGNEGSGKVTITYIDSLADTLVFKHTGVGRFGMNVDRSAGNLGGSVIMENGMYKWTVPKDGLYEITAAGAGGGAASTTPLQNGKGAIMKGKTKLTKGEVLTILVGQKGKENGNDVLTTGGGGGGTYVVYGPQNPLVIAGAGGGGGQEDNSNASLTTSGKSGTEASAGAGGVSGGAGKLGYSVGGGAGFKEGSLASGTGNYMYAPTNPGAGGGGSSTPYFVEGGFGGGSYSNRVPGGGGGYSGGGGAGGGIYSDGKGYSRSGSAGGGGSFSALENQLNEVANVGQGEVKITYLKEVPLPVTITGMSPANNSTVSGNAINFTWSGSAEAERYHLEIGTAPGLKDVFNQDTLTTALHKLSTQPDKNYFWRVRAYTEDAGWGEWSQEWQVRSVFPVLDFLSQYQTADGKTITQSTAQKQIVAVGSTVRLHFTPRNHRVLEYAVSHVYQGRITNLNKRGAYGSDTESNYIGLDFSQPLRGLNGETIKAEKGSVFIIDFKVSSETGAVVEKQVKILIGSETDSLSILN